MEEKAITDFAVAYTLSDKGSMIEDCLRSLKSLSRFVDKESIVVFYTPPRGSTSKLSKYAQVVQCENITSPFIFKPSRGPGRYGEKIHLCDLDQENVIYLDCDTEVKKDLFPLLDGDYDFAARPGIIREFDLASWCKMFSEYDREIMPVFNAGFLIFKNNKHREIKDDWLKYLEADLPHLRPETYPKEQYALALAVAGLKVRYLTRWEHAFVGNNEEHLDTYVLHGTQRRLKYIRLMLRHSPLRRLKHGK